MGNLYPGGSRAKGGRVFGSSAIKRACKESARRHLEGSETTIAEVNRHSGEPHKNSREIARNLKRKK